MPDRPLRTAEGAIVARAPAGTALYRGLVTCGSVTACPWMLVAKGRATLVWSRGLRAKLLPDLEDRTDAQIAADPTA